MFLGYYTCAAIEILFLKSQGIFELDCSKALKIVL